MWECPARVRGCHCSVTETAAQPARASVRIRAIHCDVASRKRTMGQNAGWTTGTTMRSKGKSGSLGAMTLGALGVVYGDIGTSPLYTLHEIFLPHSGVPLDTYHVIGAVSTIFWGLMLVVT